MDGQAQPIAPEHLYARLGTAQAPVLLDVRRQEAFIGDDRLIVGAFHRSPFNADALNCRLVGPPTQIIDETE